MLVTPNVFRGTVAVSGVCLTEKRMSCFGMLIQHCVLSALAKEII